MWCYATYNGYGRKTDSLKSGALIAPLFFAHIPPLHFRNLWSLVFNSIIGYGGLSEPTLNESITPIQAKSSGNASIMPILVGLNQSSSG